MADRKTPSITPLLALRIDRSRRMLTCESIFTFCTKISSVAAIALSLPTTTLFAQSLQGRGAPSAAELRLMEAEKAFLHSLTAQSFTDSGDVNEGFGAAAAQKGAASKGRAAPSEEANTIQYPVKAAAASGQTITQATNKAALEAAPKVIKVAAAAPAQKNEIAFEKIEASGAPSGKGSSGATAPSAPVLEKQSAPSVKPATGETEILKNSNANLRRELQSAQSKIEELQRSLDQARSELALTETELTRLSARLDSKNRASLGKYNLPLGSASQPSSAPPHAARVTGESTQPRPRVAEVKPPAANTDMPIATVSVDKADLRLGPGKNHSALMAVPRGSRLVVETRQGEWYRVFAPSGERAWIQSGMVLFGDGASLLNDGTAARVKGFNPNDEEEAFRRVQRMAAGQ